MKNTNMKPIFFKGEMVRVILEGRKTQTRMVVKPQRHPFGHMMQADKIAIEFIGGTLAVRPPYSVGDILYVREAWRLAKSYDKKSGKQLEGILTARNVQYESEADTFLVDENRGRYRHARFMPKWAARIFLKVTAIRIERLNEISEEDAKSEGCFSFIGRGPRYTHHTYINDFATLWQSIYGNWDENPWVWVIEFERTERPEGV
jgi:hypothetical protein